MILKYLDGNGDGMVDFVEFAFVLESLLAKTKGAEGVWPIRKFFPKLAETKVCDFYC